MGGGSTGHASLKHNRGFIGIEINKEHFASALDRLDPNMLLEEVPPKKEFSLLDFITTNDNE